ncbi:DUF2207 domain-containing protein [Ornithobacterium rhinotracheale]|uniref:DUF2207 domain-containing protein n=1 Tax=Ornithobacterium rhinotracheale TaxID=28251 RepID=UPI00129C186F|nr:DUF2207 domain-containing protein [Ornithobacterium rhinotracheale]MRI62730.1 DUF2207 domain-containing protein [Ornithobacterium rhinotracheale]
MKNRFFVFFLLFCANVFAQEERILNFHSDIKVEESSDIQVQEKIKVHSEGINIRRGIFRVLPTIRKKNTGNYKVTYHVSSVLRDGVEEPYFTEINDGKFYIYIGDKNNFLLAGDYEYQINYTADNQIGYFDTYDEFYWNVNGSYWDFPIDEVSANIVLPHGVKVESTACYTGAYGEDKKDCGIEAEEGVVSYKAENLSIGEGLTVAVAFTKGAVLAPAPPSFLEKCGITILSIILLIPTLFYCYKTWDKYGRDYPSPVVVPQFNVPNNMSPGTVGMFNELNVKSKFFSAAVVHLAIKGYLKIEEIVKKGFFADEKYYKLIQLKDPDNSLPEEEQYLLKELFRSKTEKIIGKKYDEDLSESVQAFKDSLIVQNDYLIRKGANLKFLTLPILLVFGLNLALIAFCYINQYKDDSYEETLVLSAFSFVISFFLLIIPAFVRSFNTVMILYSIASLFLVGTAVLYLVEMGEDYYFLSIPRLLVSIGLSVLLFYRILIKRPSIELLETQSLIKGLKMYLGFAEEKKLQYFNPPKLTPQVFEEMLPYAMVLGTDGIWGKKFQQLVNEGMVSKDYAPTWYVGNFNNFYLFSSNLNYGLAESVTTSMTPPSSNASSSSGGFGSGSFGGGFSGGGGGGGGGGGW